MNKTIDELDEFPIADYGNPSQSIKIPAFSDGKTSSITIENITDKIKKDLGYMVRVLEKCKHCGQYGAVMCACPACGAPIDPIG